MMSGSLSENNRIVSSDLWIEQNNLHKLQKEGDQGWTPGAHHMKHSIPVM